MDANEREGTWITQLKPRITRISRIKMWRRAWKYSPDPPDLIGIDDFVHGDDSQSKARGLANEHAIKGIAMMFGEILEETAIVDVWSQGWHTDALQFVRVNLVPIVGDVKVEALD